MTDEYFAFRLFLVKSDQTNLFDIGESNKSILKNTLNFVKTKGKVEFIDNNVRYLICFIKDFDEHIYIFQFAKEEQFSKPDEGEKTIETIQDKRFPFVYMIFDFERQILLLQNKTSLFKEIDIPKSKIEKYLEGFFRRYDIFIKISELSSEKSFWKQLNEYDQVFSLEIELTGPNLFGARFKADELVKEVNKQYNANQFNIKLKNSVGKLKLLRDNVSEYFRLAASGAGKVIAEVAKNGLKDKIGSFKYILKKHFDHDINNLTFPTLDQEFNELDKHNESIDEENNQDN